MNADIRAYQSARDKAEREEIMRKARDLLLDLRTAGLGKSASNMQEVIRSLDWETTVPKGNNG